MEYDGASTPLFPEGTPHSDSNRHPKSRICVKPATAFSSAFFWQLTWIICDEKQSTLSTSCHNTLSNGCISLPTHRSVWLSGSHLADPSSTPPWGPPFSTKTSNRPQESYGMSSSGNCSSSPISRLKEGAIRRARGRGRRWWWSVTLTVGLKITVTIGWPEMDVLTLVAGLCDAAAYSPTTGTIAHNNPSDCSQGRCLVFRYTLNMR